LPVKHRYKSQLMMFIQGWRGRMGYVLGCGANA
jgi:hypothetical protein